MDLFLLWSWAPGGSVIPITLSRFKMLKWDFPGRFLCGYNVNLVPVPEILLHASVFHLCNYALKRFRCNVQKLICIKLAVRIFFCRLAERVIVCSCLRSHKPFIDSPYRLHSLSIWLPISFLYSPWPALSSQSLKTAEETKGFHVTWVQKLHWFEFDIRVLQCAAVIKTGQL